MPITTHAQLITALSLAEPLAASIARPAAKLNATERRKAAELLRDFADVIRRAMVRDREQAETLIDLPK